MDKLALALLSALAFAPVHSAEYIFGIAAHNMGDDAFYDVDDNREQENPLGIIRVEWDLVQGRDSEVEGFCEHVSSIPNGEDKGLNMCGFQLRIK